MIKSRKLHLFFIAWFKFGLPIAALASIPSFVLFVIWGTRFPFLFSDWDESFYLYTAIQHYKHFREFGLGNVLNGHVLSYPNVFVDVIFGGLFSISESVRLPILFGLDVVCDSLALACLILISKVYFVNRYKAIAVALVGVYASSLFHPRYLFWMPWNLSSHIVTIPLSLWGCIPTNRGIYTQLSVVLFLLSLLLACYAMRLRTKRPGKLVSLSGVCAGLNIYFYFYGWIVGLVVIGLYITLTTQTVRRRLINLLVFGGSWLACSSFGIMLLMSQHWRGSLKFGQNIETVWFAPIESLAVIAIIAFFLPRKHQETTTSLIKLLFATLVAEVFLHNSQPFFRTQLATYHFDVFYTGPVFSFLFLLLLVRGAFRKVADRYFYYSLIIAFPILVFASTIIYYKAALHNNRYVDGLKLLERYSDQDMFAVSDKEDSINLYIAALTEIKPFFLPPLPDYTVERRTKNSILLNRMFRGEFSRGYTCSISNPSDPRFFYWRGISRQRVTTEYDLLFCSSTKYSYSVCEAAVEEFPNILIVSKNKDPMGEERLLRFSSLRRISSSADYVQFYVESREKFQRELCLEEKHDL